MNKPNVFISSTCYDLNQIRADLYDFLNKLNLTPQSSEYSTFPINPNQQIIDNCLNNIKNFSDIFILIIGNRYGFVTDIGKSITNLEYLHAKKKNIPIYVFILKSVSNILPVWEKNKDADFTNQVDSIKIFEFINEIKNVDKNWWFEFEKAQDIINAMKIQLSYLFKDSLNLRYKILNSNLPDFWPKISNCALNILLEKHDLYELYFFYQVIVDELKNNDNLINDFEYNIILRSKKAIDSPVDLTNWLNQQFKSLLNLVHSLMVLYNDLYPKFWGKKGEPSDLKGLLYIAKSISNCFNELLNLLLDIKSVAVDDKYINLINYLVNTAKPLVEVLSNFPTTFKNIVDQVTEKYNKEDQNINFVQEIVFSVDEKYAEMFSNEIERLSKAL